MLPGRAGSGVPVAPGGAGSGVPAAPEPQGCGRSAKCMVPGVPVAPGNSGLACPKDRRVPASPGTTGEGERDRAACAVRGCPSGAPGRAGWREAHRRGPAERGVSERGAGRPRSREPRAERARSRSGQECAGSTGTLKCEQGSAGSTGDTLPHGREREGSQRGHRGAGRGCRLVAGSGAGSGTGRVCRQVAGNGCRQCARQGVRAGRGQRYLLPAAVTRPQHRALCQGLPPARAGSTHRARAQAAACTPEPGTCSYCPGHGQRGGCGADLCPGGSWQGNPKCHQRAGEGQSVRVRKLPPVSPAAMCPPAVCRDRRQFGGDVTIPYEPTAGARHSPGPWWMVPNPTGAGATPRLPELDPCWVFLTLAPRTGIGFPRAGESCPGLAGGSRWLSCQRGRGCRGPGTL